MTADFSHSVEVNDKLYIYKKTEWQQTSCFPINISASSNIPARYLDVEFFISSLRTDCQFEGGRKIGLYNFPLQSIGNELFYPFHLDGR